MLINILIGCGDSGTSDGGAGMAQALGVQFFDKNQQIVDINGGEDLLKVDSIVTTNIDRRLQTFRLMLRVTGRTFYVGKKELHVYLDLKKERLQNKLNNYHQH